MECAGCNFENREGAKFCKNCGAKLEFVCPSCGHCCDPDSSFCDECGHDLRKRKESPPIDYNAPQSYTPKHLADKILSNRTAIEGERKLVTILFADVANSTAMFEKLDPEAVHEIMDGCFRILMDEIHRYEGTVNQFRGDGLMALFGAPIGHEDHSQRACHAALAVQKALAPYRESLKNRYGIDFTMRIGLNSGPVVVGSIGDDLRMDYTAQGDTANLAARMESNAEPGNVLVSKHTYKLARGFFDFESLGEIQVKGKAEPVKTYQLVKPSKVATRIEASVAKGLTRFVGRRREIETLKEGFERARSGEGQVIGVVGEAGVGKSRLLLEFRNSLPKGEHIYLEGRCLHYGSSMPYLPILDAFRTYLGIKEGEKESVIKQKMMERIVGSDESLTRCLPPIQELFSIKVDDEGFAKLEPKQKREKTFEAIRDILIRGSQSRPIVWAIEDLHWIDRTTEEFLDYMIGWLPNTRILLILLYRPEYMHQWGSKSYYSKVGVGQLSSGRSAELVQAILEGGDVVPELRELVLSRASGNPLYMEELTHSLLEDGSVQKEGDQYVLARNVSEIRVPDTIQGIIAARMDRLEESLKRIMQVASVIGREFAFRILQAITEMREDLKSNLLNLQGLEFIYEKSLFPELEYIFRHALTQEVAYNSLLIKRRKEIHERIGQAIESLYPERLEEFYEMLAFHYERAEIPDKALHYLNRAADRAKAIYANEESIAFYRAAIEQASKLRPGEGALFDEWYKIASHLQENVADVLELTGRHDEALKAYESALVDGSMDPVRKAHLHRKTGNAWREQRCYEKAQSAYDLAEMALAKEATELAQEWWQAWIEIQCDRMLLHYWQAKFHQIAELAEKARPAVEQYGTPDLRSRFFAGLVLMALRRDRYVISEETMAHAQACLEAIRKSGKPSAIAFAQFMLGFSHLWRGELDEAGEHMQAALKLAERIGDVVVQSRCLTYLTILHRKRAQLKAVQQYISRALDVAMAGNMLEYVSTAKANLAWVKWYVGNLSEAQENGRIALDMWQKEPLVYPFQWTALWPLISVALSKEEVSTAVDYANALLQPSQQRLPASLNEVLEEVIESWEKGESEKARTKLNRAIELAQELGWF